MLKWLALLLAFPIVLIPPAAPGETRSDATDAVRIRQALDTLAAHPLSTDAGAAAALILDVAEKSGTLVVAISPESAPWLASEQDVPHGELLLAAHIAGNMLAQLDSGVFGNDAYSGTLQVFRVYRQLQAEEKAYRVPAVEVLLQAHRDGELAARVHTSESAATPGASPDASGATASDTRTNPKAEGFVPDAETAIAIAIAVWEPIYGREHIANKKPYKATLKGDVWTVQGSLPEHHNKGGVPEAQINRRNGLILKVIHGR